jgi:predicted RNase H-like nuclease (RuvC/YqgF family)
MSLAKNVVQYGVLAALVGGAAVVVAGPDTMGALLTQTRGEIRAGLDSLVKDPVALRAQMRSLAEEYPRRLAEVGGDLAELREQKAQLRRELEVSHRVVDMAGTDLAQLSGLIERGQEAQAQASAAGVNHVVRVVFNDGSLELKDAYGKAMRIQQVQQAYATRATEIERDMGYLDQQEERLAQLHEQLQTEYQQFQAQMWTLDRQVDSIARNDRLIAMMERRQRTIDEQSRYSAGSLDALAARFAEIRAKQEARLEGLGTSSQAMNYEDRAKVDLDFRNAPRPGVSRPSGFRPAPPTVIEITPEMVNPAPAPEDSAQPLTSSPERDPNAPGGVRPVNFRRGT